MKKNLLYINFYKSMYGDISELYKQQRNTISYKAELTNFFNVSYVINSNITFNENYKGVHITSKNKNAVSFLIFICSYIRKNNVDIVIIHGTHYFLQAACIKLFCKTKVILQHHAEKTYLSKKAVFMRFCKRFVDLYFFTGKDVALPFIERKCISETKIAEVVAGTTDFQIHLEKNTNKIKELCFVGRLNKNKNLMTVLKAIVKLKTLRSDFRLSVYYSTNEEEKDLKIFCQQNDLNELVIFKGKIANSEVEKILNVGDIYISASFNESCGFALIEALACGCYPVVSRIPSFNFLLQGLEHKKQFSPDDAEELASTLNEAINLDLKETTRKEIRRHFEQTSSPQAIAKQINQAVQAIL